MNLELVKNSIDVGSKVKLRGRKTRGVSFKVLSIDRWNIAKIQHNLSGFVYEEPLYDLELIKKK